MKSQFSTVNMRRVIAKAILAQCGIRTNGENTGPIVSDKVPSSKFSTYIPYTQVSFSFKPKDAYHTGAGANAFSVKDFPTFSLH